MATRRTLPACSTSAATRSDTNSRSSASCAPTRKNPPPKAPAPPPHDRCGGLPTIRARPRDSLSRNWRAAVFHGYGSALFPSNFTAKLVGDFVPDMSVEPTAEKCGTEPPGHGKYQNEKSVSSCTAACKYKKNGVAAHSHWAGKHRRIHWYFSGRSGIQNRVRAGRTLRTLMKSYFVVPVLLAAVAFGQQTPNSPAKPSQEAQPVAPENAKPAQAPATPAHKVPDHAAAYYHYSMAHIYEELVSVYGRSDLANKAIEEYRLAIENDPSSEFLNNGLAELYWKTGRIRDAVLEAQDLLKRDPKNLAAHKLLGRIYLRSLGDMQSGNNGGSSNSVLKLAIEQYEQIVKI